MLVHIIAAPKAGSATGEMLYVLTNDNAEYWYHVVEINLINTFLLFRRLGPDEREAQGYTWFTIN